MSSDEILAQVRDIIADVLEQPDLKVDRDTSAEDVRNWDSFNHMKIVLAVQTRFGIKIHAPEVEELRQVGSLVDFIERKLAAKK